MSFLVAGIFYAGKTATYWVDGQTATGTVQSITEEDDCRSSNHSDCIEIYRPTVRYVTADGDEVVFTSETASSGWDWPVGHQIAVRYRPGHPHDAIVDGFSANWGNPIIFIGFGLLFGVVPVVIFVLYRRELRRERMR